MIDTEEQLTVNFWKLIVVDPNTDSEDTDQFDHLTIGVDTVRVVMLAIMGIYKGSDSAHGDDTAKDLAEILKLD